MAALDAGVVAAVAPLVLVGELPDKTMFATLVLASRGRPAAVWAGAAAAFAVHVGIAVSAGAALVAVVPHRVLQVVVAAALLAAGVAAVVLAVRGGGEEEVDAPAAVASPRAGRVALAAAGVVFVAEWGDLTQVLVVELAARYHRPASVALGSLVALWAAAGIAVVAGRGLGRVIDERVLRAVTGVALLALGGWALAGAA